MADRAVCVGINDYPVRGMKLRGCRNDATAWARVLVDHFDVASGDVTLLLDADATKQRILSRLRKMVRDARPGDRLVFTNSGHGTYVADDDGDEPRYDEALCPYDCADQLIVDDDLGAILDELPAKVRFTFISDSCHSGTVTRTVPWGPHAGRRIRFANPTMMGRRASVSVARREATRRRTRSESAMPEVLISGCLDSEYAFDAKFGNRYHGAMTFHALSSLAAANWKIRYDDWVRDLNTRLADDMFNQHPQLEGRSASKRRAVFR
jgi:hypothetical protein